MSRRPCPSTPRSSSASYDPTDSPSSSSGSTTAASIFSPSSATTSSAPTPPSSPSPSPAAVRTLAVPLVLPALRAPTQVVLPRTLARPHPQPISPAALAAAGPELAGVPLPYILIGPQCVALRCVPRADSPPAGRMMAALARTTAPVPPALPHSLAVCVAPDPDPGPDAAPEALPTHLLAVYAR